MFNEMTIQELHVVDRDEVPHKHHVLLTSGKGSTSGQLDSGLS
jgi:hypothetical protein